MSPIRAELDNAISSEKLILHYLCCGIGPVAAAVALTEQLLRQQVDLVLNLGIAGALDSSLLLGELVRIRADSFADLGAEDQNGSHLNLAQLGIASPTQIPALHTAIQSVPWPKSSRGSWKKAIFQGLDGWLLEQKAVEGATVSRAHGSAGSIARFKEYSSAQVESMEGAAIFYVAFRQNTPAIQLRTISNYVEPRNRDAWQIGLALDTLTQQIVNLLQHLQDIVAEAKSE